MYDTITNQYHLDTFTLNEQKIYKNYLVTSINIIQFYSFLILFGFLCVLKYIYLSLYAESNFSQKKKSIFLKIYQHICLGW